MIRLIATDIDHTLMTSDRVPHPRSVAALREASKVGIVIVFASGRIGHSIREVSEKVEVMGPIIACNGADVFGPGLEDWGHYRLDRTMVDLLVDFADETQVQANIYTREQVTFLGESEWSRRYLQRLNQTEIRHIVVPRSREEESLRALDVSKVLFVDHPERIQKLRGEIEPRLNSALARVTESEAEYLEFLAPHASKGAGLAVIAEKLGIPLEETAAIGDFLNDVEMLKTVGFSAAVGNAKDVVKQIADVTVGTNDEGGVGEFIEGILSGRWRLQ